MSDGPPADGDPSHSGSRLRAWFEFKIHHRHPFCITKCPLPGFFNSTHCKEADVLVLSRKIGEITRIGDAIEVVVLEVKKGRMKLGFASPRDVQILGAEFAGISEFA